MTCSLLAVSIFCFATEVLNFSIMAFEVDLLDFEQVQNAVDGIWQISCMILPCIAFVCNFIIFSYWLLTPGCHLIAALAISVSHHLVSVLLQIIWMLGRL